MTPVGFIKGKLAYTTALVLMAVLTSTTQANPIFSFSDAPSPTSITSGGSTLTLTGGSGAGQDAGFPGGANETILNINLSSTTSSPAFDSFGSPISFPLTITDTASGNPFTIPFSGTLSGALNTSTSSITLSSVTPPTPFFFNLGGNMYTVTLTFPNFLTLGNNNINANVQAVALPAAVPEPGSILLWGAVGMVGVWYGRRKLRRKLAA